MPQKKQRAQKPRISNGFQKAAHIVPVSEITHHKATEKGLVWFEDLLKHPKKLTDHFKRHRADFVEPLLHLAMTDRRRNSVMCDKARHLLAEALIRPEARGIAALLAINTENLFAPFLQSPELDSYRPKILSDPGFIQTVCVLQRGISPEDFIFMIKKCKPEIQAQIFKADGAFSGLVRYGAEDSTFLLLKKLEPKDQYEILSAKSTKPDATTNIQALMGYLFRKEKEEAGQLFDQLQQEFGPSDKAPAPSAA